ncbi:hypothetical protein RGL42_002698 [Vibrio parahaemolyticus]|nr:hypothetical protein [Vibrio parahaemolyticus]ELA8111177.1 hypothetical protein [Vibrio parahaemolyticus]ELA8164909.1 hypothetical protein [Vibrio parahaemolyticus]
MKEFLDVLNKAKNVKLNLAIFLVVVAMLSAQELEFIKLEPVIKTLLQSLFFLTVIRLVYAVIAVVSDVLEGWQKSKKNSELAKESALRDAEERKRKVHNMRQQFHELDIFQLYIVQELKRQNHVSVRKGAALFTLKNANIVYTPAVGDSTESASLTSPAKKLLNEELWAKFESLKHDAIFRYFDGMQPKDIEHFSKFLSKESIYTGGSVNKDSERVFSALSKSVVFSQPQRNYSYTLDPVAKDVLNSIWA